MKSSIFHLPQNTMLDKSSDDKRTINFKRSETPSNCAKIHGDPAMGFNSKTK